MDTSKIKDDKLEQRIQAEGAALAAGGVVLGQASPPQPTPEDLMRLAGARIRELEVMYDRSQTMAAQVAAVTAALMKILVDAVDGWEPGPDGSMQLRIREEALNRAQGARIGMKPAEDGDGMECQVILAENFELYDTFHAAPDAADELADTLGLKGDEGEVPEAP